jgi:hypothetical protein
MTWVRVANHIYAAHTLTIHEGVFFGVRPTGLDLWPTCQIFRAGPLNSYSNSSAEVIPTPRHRRSRMGGGCDDRIAHPIGFE